MFAALADESRHPQARWYVDLMSIELETWMEGWYEEALGNTARYMAVARSLGISSDPPL